MKQDKANTKAKIYQATLELLASGEEASHISTRQIAAKAGVNLALVNYYYQSKENLLSEVVGNMMGKIILLETDFFDKQKRDQKIIQMIECVLSGLSKGI